MDSTQTRPLAKDERFFATRELVNGGLLARVWHQRRQGKKGGWTPTAQQYPPQYIRFWPSLPADQHFNAWLTKLGVTANKDYRAKYIYVPGDEVVLPGPPATFKLVAESGPAPKLTITATGPNLAELMAQTRRVLEKASGVSPKALAGKSLVELLTMLSGPAPAPTAPLPTSHPRPVQPPGPLPPPMATSPPPPAPASPAAPELSFVPTLIRVKTEKGKKALFAEGEGLSVRIWKELLEKLGWDAKALVIDQVYDLNGYRAVYRLGDMSDKPLKVLYLTPL